MFRQTIASLKWLTHFYKLLIAFFILSLPVSYALATNHWRQLAPGIEYQDVKGNLFTPWSHIHAFRINLNDNEFSLITAKELTLAHASIHEYARFSNALLAINGGFFDTAYQPLGLRISNKHQKNSLKNISWWGIFYIKNNKAYLKNINQYKADNQDFAIQSGPRLLINRKIPPLRPGRASRSALGITKDGRVIILVTDNHFLSTTELALIMKAPPLNCENALNLDGGSSSQLSARLTNFQIDVPGFSNVSDAIIVKAK